MQRVVVPFLLGACLACSSESPTPAAEKSAAKTEPAPDAKTAPAPDAKTEPDAKTAPDAKTEPAPDAKTEPAPDAPPAAANEVAITPWTTKPFAPTWRTVAEPSDAIAFVQLDAGILARAGSSWFTRGEGDAIVALTMDREPNGLIFGVWPSDAWFVDSRTKEEDGEEYLELRLMKLRGGDRWVPQQRASEPEQWYRSEDDAPHMSAVSGMLVYGDSYESIERVSGKLGDPTVGPHRGEVAAIVESGQGKLYVISSLDGATWAQIACEDADDPDACVAERAMKLPLSGWTFGRAVARGKHSVSVLASSSGREFILHHRGKSDGWVLDELPAGEVPSFMWASEEGSLWTLAGERLRWRDTDSAWHEVALPEGLGSPSLALTEDRKEVWLAGSVGGATKIFACSANTVTAPAAP